ncbi:putative ubiquitinyl hydrolase 1 [Rosa chinensis]|uniref:Putative ubiquitinyl hydrolase 1 n=1 Tax=Rosa chinensis TaxID=74649 RepID=A0A2P6SB99_ROSCH|nr:putative ubiquitinyl hydrolase 1 [Rosa chinensis]
MMENEENDLASGTFTWKIDKFSKLNADKCYSEVFVIGGFKWRVSLYPKGYIVRHSISMYLEVADSSKLPSGWTRYAKFSFTLVNQLDRILSKTKSIHTFLVHILCPILSIYLLLCHLDECIFFKNLF